MEVAETILFAPGVSLKFENVHEDENILSNLNQSYLVSCVTGNDKNLSTELSRFRESEKTYESSG